MIAHGPAHLAILLALLLGAGCSSCNRTTEPAAWAIVARSSSAVDVWSDTGQTRRLELDSSRITEMFGEPGCGTAVAVACGWQELFPSADPNLMVLPVSCISPSAVGALDINTIVPRTMAELKEVCGTATPIGSTAPHAESREEVGLSAAVAEVGAMRIVTTTLERANEQINGQVAYPADVDRRTASLATRLALGCAAIENDSLAGVRLSRVLADSAVAAGVQLLREVYRRPFTQSDNAAEMIKVHATELGRVGWVVCSAY